MYETSAATTRKIIHCDCDSFYASVEMRDNPSLLEKAIAVGGSPDQRGVIATCNYKAREFGLHSAMPMSQALRACPDLVIRSTFIAGFPGETEEEFQYLLDFLDEAQIDRAGCFAYSPVDGATANALDNPVPVVIREERRAQFMAKAEAISVKRLAKKIGRRIQVLIDRVDESGGIGRTAGDAPEIDGLVRVLAPSKPSKRYRAGEIIKVTVISSQGHDLIAET